MTTLIISIVTAENFQCLASLHPGPPDGHHDKLHVMLLGLPCLPRGVSTSPLSLSSPAPLQAPLDGHFLSTTFFHVHLFVVSSWSSPTSRRTPRFSHALRRNLAVHCFLLATDVPLLLQASALLPRCRARLSIILFHVLVSGLCSDNFYSFIQDFLTCCFFLQKCVRGVCVIVPGLLEIVHISHHLFDIQCAHRLSIVATVKRGRPSLYRRCFSKKHAMTGASRPVLFQCFFP